MYSIIIIYDLYKRVCNCFLQRERHSLSVLKGMVILLLILLVPVGPLSFTRAAAEELPYYLNDRGTGMPTSMFGTYIRSGEFIFYPFYEFYYDRDMEYKPSELGYNQDKDYKGKYVAHEGLIYLAYGITDWLMIEAEAAVIKAKLNKSSNDTSNMPESIEESGLGDVEGQIRWRWFKEKEYRPEFFSFFETVAPTQKNDDVLIGTPGWEYKLGFGVIKGFRWGTVTLRGAVAHDTDENKTEFGEYAVEYLKKISDLFRVLVAVEGEQDEVTLIAELQIHLHENVYLKLNNGFGLTSKATDYAPEVGVLFHF